MLCLVPVLSQGNEFQLYQAHFDYSDKVDALNMRFATILVYLSTPKNGGETGYFNTL